MTTLKPVCVTGSSVQVALVICGLFICDFAYMQLKLWHFRGTYPLIYQCYWSPYMRICYMRTIFLGPYLSHITRSACIPFSLNELRFSVYTKRFFSSIIPCFAQNIPIVQCFSTFLVHGTL